MEITAASGLAGAPVDFARALCNEPARMKPCSLWRRHFPPGAILTVWCVVSLLMPGAMLQAAPAAAAGKPRFVVVKLARGPMNRLLLEVALEAKKGVMILDTGASATLVDPRTYGFLLPGPKRELPPGLPAKIKGNGRELRVGFATEVKIGSVDLGALALVVAAPGMFSEGSGLTSGVKVDGLLGEDLLRRYRAVVDCARLFLYLTLDSAPKEDSGPSLVAAGWTRVPMRDLGGNFTVDCQFGQRRYRLFVDTGAPFTTLDSGLVNQERIAMRELPLNSGFVGTRKQKTFMVGSRSLTIGSYVAKDVEMIARRDLVSSLTTEHGPGPALIGVLGCDLLAQNNAIVDIGNSCLYLKSSAPSEKKKR
jgi:hypothetical protein